MRSFYEPWTPAIGQRVEVHLSAECQERWGDTEIVDAHPWWADGKVGTVQSLMIPMTAPAEIEAAYTRHPYFVRLDEDGPGGTYGLCLAAAELIPADDEQDDESAWPPAPIEGDEVPLPGFDVPERPEEGRPSWTA
jgi:hypothetical protein